MKLVLMDERTVMFAMADPAAGTDDLTTVVIEHVALAKVLQDRFRSGVGNRTRHRASSLPPQNVVPGQRMTRAG
jgi:hypothetical protein